MVLIDRLEFRSRVVSTDSSSHVNDLGDFNSVMELNRGQKKDSLFIEWFSADGEQYFAEIGLTLKGKKVIDYDGVSNLPKQAIALLKKNGFDTSEL